MNGLWYCWLPMPISDNDYYRRNKAQGRSQKGRLFAEECGRVVRAQFGAPPMIDVPVHGRFVLFPRDHRTRDAANFNKALWDAVSHSPNKKWHGAGLLVDDHLVVCAEAEMGAVTKKAALPYPDYRCLVVLQEVSGEPPTAAECAALYPLGEI